MAKIKNKISYMLAFLAGIGSVLDLSGRSFIQADAFSVKMESSTDRENLMNDWKNVVGDIRTSFDRMTDQNKSNGQKSAPESKA